MYAADYTDRKDIVEYLSNQRHDLSVVEWSWFQCFTLHCFVQWWWRRVWDCWIVWTSHNSTMTSSTNNKTNTNLTPLHCAAMDEQTQINCLVDGSGRWSFVERLSGVGVLMNILCCSDETKNIIRNFKKWWEKVFIFFYFFFLIHFFNEIFLHDFLLLNNFECGFLTWLNTF